MSARLKSSLIFSLTAMLVATLLRSLYHALTGGPAMPVGELVVFAVVGVPLLTALSYRFVHNKTPQ